MCKFYKFTEKSIKPIKSVFFRDFRYNIYIIKITKNYEDYSRNRRIPNCCNW